MRRNSNVLEALDQIGERPNLFRVKPSDLFCNTYATGKCVATLAGVPLYFDDNHLSNAGAGMVTREIMKIIAK